MNRKCYNLAVVSAFVAFLVLSTNTALAKSVTFQREYTYQASEADSKLSCRAIALEQVKRLLLEELGTYLQSETVVKNYQLTKDQVITLTAGVVRTKILEEKWDGKTYYIKAELVADQDEVAKHIQAMQKRSGGIGEIPEWLKEYVEFADDLPKHVLMPPFTADIKSAKKLIVLPILYGIMFKGDWFLAHGMLGVSRIPNEEAVLYTRLGYESLFKSTAVESGSTKIQRVVICGDSLLLFCTPSRKLEPEEKKFIDEILKFAPPDSPQKRPTRDRVRCSDTKSWIFWREHYLGAIGYYLEERFIFDNGSYAIKPNLKPSPRRHRHLKKEIESAYDFYSQIKKKGFDDKTLGDAIGIAYAFVKYDAPDYYMKDNPLLRLPSSEQIYSDTALAVLKEVSKGKEFFDALFREMNSRGLMVGDVLTALLGVVPRDQALAALKLLIEDLDLLEKELEATKKE